VTVAQFHHPAFPQPATPTAAIWRYLTRSKFEWLVKEGRLFFPNAANLGDPLEGTQPIGDANWWRELGRQAASDDQRQIIANNHHRISRFARAYRTRYYVSCWHINEAENPAMWDQYAPGLESIAIRTTVAKLRLALPAYIEIGVVRYIDYAVERLPTLNMFQYITHKNKAFEHEQELRAVALHPILDGPDKQHFESNFFESVWQPGTFVFAPAVDLAALVEDVVLRPDAPALFAQDIDALRAKSPLPALRRASW
jgi:hypothetical protein